MIDSNKFVERRAADHQPDPMFQHRTHNKEIIQMNKWSFLATALCVPMLVFAQGKSDSGPEDLTTTGEPSMLGIHWARGFDPFARANQAHSRGGSPLMTYHGGKIMPTAITQNIFWGTSWTTNPGDKISGLDTWYSGFSGSNYAKTCDEYTGTNGQVGPTISYQGHSIDGSPSSGGGSTAVILAEVCKVVKNPDPSGNGYYSVYSDTPRGRANYCAYHSVGTCGGVTVQFAFFFKLDGDPGCDPQDTTTGHSQGLAALANVSGHELSEARTDPANPGAWYDGSGAENGDKCAWTFNVPHVTFNNGTIWKIQGEWSNAAYNAGTGYPNSSGQKGCVDGH
jgi:hypothetical protein